MQISVLDAGQGDSLLLKTPYGHTILIDGGPDESIREKISERFLPWEKHIDLVILTHPDRDHIAGLNALLRYYDASTILWTGVERETRDFQTWKRILEEQQRRGGNIVIAKSGQRILWGRNKTVCFDGHFREALASVKKCPGLAIGEYIDILHPTEDVQGKIMEKSNDTGIVSRLVFHGVSALFTADISRSVEERFVQEGEKVQSDILKVAHHGSKYSSSPLFIGMIHPRVAVISVGANNTYGHPTLETLATLEQYGIEVHRTDMEGDITLFLR